MKYLDNLNELQLEAVKETEGPICVISGAGTGKTRTLTAKVIYLIEELGISPKEIVAMTFTNKACLEMKNRIKFYIGKSLANPNITTIHGFCLKFLKDYITTLRFANNFSLCDDEDYSKKLIEIRKTLKKEDRITLDKMKEEVKIYKFKYYSQFIEAICQKEYTTDLFEKLECANFIKDLFRFQKEYQTLFFDDLILFTLFILEQNEDIRKEVSSKISYLLIDEFQDTTYKQFEIMKLLVSENNNIFVVGDPEQSIYGFNGSDYNIFDHFVLAFKDHKMLKLSLNYRSYQEILDVANALIRNNNSKFYNKLVAFRKKSNSKPRVFYCENIEKELSDIISTIKRYISDTTQYSDIAILYRTNRLSRVIEEKLFKEHIPYVILRGTSFYDRKEIKLLLSYLKVAIKNDNNAFEYIVKNRSYGIKNAKLEVIRNKAFNTGLSFYDAMCSLLTSEKFTKATNLISIIEYIKSNKDNELISQILLNVYKQSGLIDEFKDLNDENRIAIVNELINHVNEQETEAKENNEKFEINTFLDNISLLNNFYSDKENANKIKLITAHSAKGMEFKHVIVFEFSDGMFPHSKCIDANEVLQERRLTFVTLTRAKDTLDIFSCKDNNGIFNQISRFVYEFYDYVDIVYPFSREYFSLQTDINNIDDSKFTVGSLVNHKVFGNGTIIEINDDVCKVKFDKYPTPKPIVTSKLTLVKGKEKEKVEYVYDPFKD